MTRWRFVVAAGIFAGGCGSAARTTGPSSGTASPSPTTVVSASPSPSPVSSPAASPSPGGAPITGDFRLRPEPDADGVVPLDHGSAMIVNAVGLTSTDPTASLRLVVSWGDDASTSIGCGPCRLEHVYPGLGQFKLTATVTDGAAAALHTATEVTRTVTVAVRPAPPGTGRSSIRITNLSFNPLSQVSVTGPQSFTDVFINGNGSVAFDVPSGHYTIRGRYVDGPVCNPVEVDVSSGRTETVRFNQASGSECTSS